MSTKVGAHLTEAGNSIAEARSVLEEATKSRRSKDFIAAAATEALEELDYAQECLTKAERGTATLAGAGESAIYAYVKQLEASGEWDRILRMEEIIHQAIRRWEQERHYAHTGSMIPFDVSSGVGSNIQPFNVSMGGGRGSAPAAQSFERYRVLIPMFARSKEQVAHIVRKQLEGLV